MEIAIKPLSAELVNDYLYFFDNMIFIENPDWEKCYCYSFHFVGPDETWNKKNNRAAVSQMIQEGSMKGYLAFVNDKPIAWCNVNDRNNYQRLTQIYKLEDSPDQKICSIVCFLVSPEYRGKGITKIFLNKVIDDYASNDYHYIEAYPDKSGNSCEKNYKGPMSLYEKNDFEIINEYDKYYVIRRALNNGW